MGLLKAIWFWLTTSTQFALIEAENERLKETCFVLENENDDLRKDLRAAVNNLLSEAGATPLPPDESVKPTERKMTHRRLSWQQRQRVYAVETRPAMPLKEKA